MKRACALLSFIIINTPNHLVTIYLVVIVKNIILTFQTLIMFMSFDSSISTISICFIPEIFNFF